MESRSESARATEVFPVPGGPTKKKFSYIMQANFPQVLSVLDSLHNLFNFVFLFLCEHQIFDFLLYIFRSDDGHEFEHFFAFVFLPDLRYKGFYPFPVNFLRPYFCLCKRIVCSLNLFYFSVIIGQDRIILNPFLGTFLLFKPFRGKIESAQAKFKMRLISNYERNVSYTFFNVLNPIQFFYPDKCSYNGFGNCFFCAAPIIFPNILGKIVFTSSSG